MNTVSLRLFTIFLSIWIIPADFHAQITINEWMTDNVSSLADEAGEFDDWIELYNDSGDIINLNGYYLSDDISAPDKFQFTTDVILNPGEYSLFWADNDLNQGDNHLNFKLSASGESIILSDPNLVALSSVNFIEQVADQSMGSFPNGSSIYYNFTMSTPATANLNNGAPAGIIKPSFNLTGGFYTSDQLVSLTHPDNGVTIYYTLNGKAPDVNDLQYNGPILINSTTVVRAMATKPGNPISSIVSNSYFINESYSLPTLSIVGDPADFFDTAIGIYANPQEEGSDWERFAQVQYFESEDLKFEVDCGIRIQGNSSVTLPKKSFRLFFESAYGDKWLDYPFFEGNEVERFRNLVLRSGYDDDLSNDDGTLLRDPFGSDKYKEAGGFVSDRKWAILTINGEYWGIYDIRESVNDHFIESHINNNDFDLIRFTANGPELKEGTMDDWNALTAFINSNDFSNPTSYAQAEEMIDMDDFINLLAFIHTDGYKSWTYGVSAYKEKTVGNKWKFTIWDLDRSLGGPYYNSFEDYEENSGLLWANFIPGALIENEGFRNRVLNRTADLLNTSFSMEQTQADLERVKNKIIEEIPQELSLWSTLSFQDWENNVAEIHEFFEERDPIIRDQAIDKYSLADINEIQLSVERLGKLKVNTIYPESFPWSGEYFEDVPITITAIPDAGYVFSHWSDNSLPNNPKVTLDFSGVKNLTAFFTLGNTESHDIVINEIHYHSAVDSNSGDWIEIYNQGLLTADISGWYLQDESDNYFNIPNGTELNSNQYLVIAEDLELFNSQYPATLNVIGGFGKQDQLSFGLSNSGELINIENADASFIDSVDYKDNSPWPEAADGQGPSLQLVSTDLDNNLAGNWSAASPTPGFENFTIIKTEQLISFNAIPEHFALDDPFDLLATSNSSLPVSFELISGPAQLNGNTITLDGISGTLTIEATQVGNAEYFPAIPVQQIVQIKKETQEITFEWIDDQLPSADPISIIACTNSSLPLTFDLVAGPATLNANVIQLNGSIGEVQIEISQAGNQTYEAADLALLSFEVSKLDQEINLSAIGDHFTLDPDFEINANVDSDLPLSYEILSGPATINSNVISLNAVQGEVIVRVFQNGDIDHNSAELLENFNVLLTAQTLDFPIIDNHLETDLPFDIAATASSGLPVTFEIVSGPATINGNTITLDGVPGLVQVKATQLGNDTYAFIETSRSFTVSEVLLMNQSIVWIDINDKFTTDAPFEIFASASSDLPVTFTIIDGPASINVNTITLDGMVGTVTIEAKQVGNAEYYPSTENYSFEVIKQDQIVFWTIIDDKYTFDDPFEIMAEATSGLPVSYSIISGPATILENTVTLDGQPGTVTIVAEQAGNDDFLASPQASISFDVIMVTPESQQIDFQHIDDQLIDADPLHLMASASSGLLVELKLVSGPAELNGEILTLDGVAGQVTISANQPGDNFFLPAPEVIQTFEVKIISSLDQLNLEDLINIYPNPATDLLYLAVDESVIQAIEIYNFLGEKMWTSTGLVNSSIVEIPISALTAGCYHLELRLMNGERMGKMFVKY